MSVEFTHVPAEASSHLSRPRSRGHGASSLRPTLESVFSTTVIDGPAGLLTNMDIAAEVALSTTMVGIALTHWSGVIDPVVAAGHIAELDRVAGGRLSLRLLLGPDGRACDGADRIGSHADALRQTDEYLMLLKRLWANDRPFDYEGPHYSVQNGFVERKGPQGSDIALRMGGVSGVALDVAGRHATVFELTPGAPEEIRSLMERVEAAASRYGRAGRIRFALPVALGSGQPPNVARMGSPAGVVQTLLGYTWLGVSEFMVVGLDDEETLTTFARDIAPVFQRTVPLRAARRTPPGPAWLWAN